MLRPLNRKHASPTARTRLTKPSSCTSASKSVWLHVATSAPMLTSAALQEWRWNTSTTQRALSPSPMMATSTPNMSRNSLMASTRPSERSRRRHSNEHLQSPSDLHRRDPSHFDVLFKLKYNSCIHSCFAYYKGHLN